MTKAGKIGQIIFKRIGFILEPGVTTQELNEVAQKTLNYHDVIAPFKGYSEPPFPAEICVSLNEEVCHGIPDENRVINAGDLVSVDIGIQVEEYAVDACRTFEVGEISEEADHLNYWTKTALKRAIRNIKAGTCWNDIAQIIENTAHNKGLKVVRKMLGHGIGKELHEEPTLRNYMCEENDSIFLKEKQTICVEPMFCMGTGDCEVAEDEWTVVTTDRTLSSHWEHCIVVTEDGCDILL